MKKICLLALLCLYYNLSHGQTILKGQVQAATTNNPISEALIYLSKARKQTITKTDGSFELSTVIYPDTLIISITGYTTQRIVVNSNNYLNIILQPNSTNLVDVEVQTGYQSVSIERATGSFAKINNELLNRKVGATILERLDGIASGLIFNRNRTANANESAIQIRGRSTILANAQPLIVVDNFPYEGDINQINPNDIESITLLKDAAASSIWGVRAGNGVIVITTKKGRVSAAPRIQFNTNLTYGEKPNLYYQPLATGASTIEMESALFARGFYNGRIGQRFPGLSPAVVIFNDRRNNLISAADSATQIQRLAGVDNRSELTDYFYRTTIAQQYALNISGGGERIQYYFSAGWDDSRFAQLGSSQNRVSLRNRTQIHVITNKLSFSSDLNFTTSTTANPSSAYLNNFSLYQSLVGANGTALPVYRDYTKAWLDTIGQGQLLPWHNKPYDDILNNNNTTIRVDTRVLLSLQYNIIKGLQVQASYQLEKGNSEGRNIQSIDTYATRDIINRFTQPNYITGIPSRAIPLGDIIDRNNQSLASNNSRLQFNYQTKWGADHRLDVLGGTEIRQIITKRSSYRRYGYTQDNETDIDVNPITLFPTLPSNFNSRISINNTQSQTVDRFISWFGNAGYSYKEKYQLNLSVRNDASNLFGVNTNQQSVPLWSAGMGWALHKENWFRSSLFNQLKLRATYGVSGNIDKTTTAFTTAILGISSVFAQPAAAILNPPNPNLSWEQIYMLNLAIDFSLLKNRVNGSVEYYIKKGKDLIGASPVAPQTGVSQFRQNIANQQTKGVDITLNAHIIKSPINWNTQLLFSYNADEITRYLVRPGQVKAYITNITSNPLEGKPWSAIFAYPWAGLDPSTGAAQGLLADTVSKNYTRLISPAGTGELQYFGSGRPTIFGNWRNDIAYKNWSISLNFVYSLGYYFRRNSILYNNAFNSSLGGIPVLHADYDRRWRTPGDEQNTQIPALTYPAIPAADEFYQYSSALVERGDHIRLRDIRLSWDMPIKKEQFMWLKACKLYAYINNVGIIWRANKQGIDPDNITGFPTPRTYAIGVQLDF